MTDEKAVVCVTPVCAERVEAEVRAEAGEAERERVRDDEVERVVLVDNLGRRHRDGHARRVGSPVQAFFSDRWNRACASEVGFARMEKKRHDLHQIGADIMLIVMLVAKSSIALASVRCRHIQAG